MFGDVFSREETCVVHTILLFLPKFFEYDEFQLMSNLLRKDSTFIDIGGNMGIYSLVAAKYINTTGRILSFEPNPQMINRFKYLRRHPDSSFRSEMKS